MFSSFLIGDEHDVDGGRKTTYVYISINQQVSVCKLLVYTVSCLQNKARVLLGGDNYAHSLISLFIDESADYANNCEYRISPYTTRRR